MGGLKIEPGRDRISKDFNRFRRLTSIPEECDSDANEFDSETTLEAPSSEIVPWCNQINDDIVVCIQAFPTKSSSGLSRTEAGSSGERNAAVEIEKSGESCKQSLAQRRTASVEDTSGMKDAQLVSNGSTDDSVKKVELKLSSSHRFSVTLCENSEGITG